jgi:hypothetical protein
MKRMFTLLFALLVVICANAQQASIHGVWTANDPDNGSLITVVLNKDGTGKLDNDAIRFTIDGNRIQVTLNGEITTYNFKLQENTLTVSGGDLDEPLKFVKSESRRK